MPVDDLVPPLFVLKFSDFLIDLLELRLEVLSVLIGFFRRCVELLQVDPEFCDHYGVLDELIRTLGQCLFILDFLRIELHQ